MIGDKVIAELSDESTASELIDITNKSSSALNGKLLATYRLELKDGSVLRLYDADEVDAIIAKYG